MNIYNQLPEDIQIIIDNKCLTNYKNYVKLGKYVMYARRSYRQILNTISYYGDELGANLLNVNKELYDTSLSNDVRNGDGSNLLKIRDVVNFCHKEDTQNYAYIHNNQIQKFYKTIGHLNLDNGDCFSVFLNQIFANENKFKSAKTYQLFSGNFEMVLSYIKSKKILIVSCDCDNYKNINTIWNKFKKYDKVYIYITEQHHIKAIENICQMILTEFNKKITCGRFNVNIYDGACRNIDICFDKDLPSSMSRLRKHYGIIYGDFLLTNRTHIHISNIFQRNIKYAEYYDCDM